VEAASTGSFAVMLSNAGAIIPAVNAIMVEEPPKPDDDGWRDDASSDMQVQLHL
jgi:hypothetical protein